MSTFNFNTWFRKLAFAAAFFMVVCLPAAYWACERFFNLNLSKSAQGVWNRIFSQFDGSSGSADTDDGGD